jgi:broad specificity phosphatase PhoE
MENREFKLVLLRHGESMGNAQGLIQGQSDHPLTEKGLDQARALADYWNTNLVHFDLIVSSPLLRASQTAEIISQKINAPIEYDSQWMERKFGSIENHSFSDINRENFRSKFYHPYDPIGETGESLVDLFQRASLALQDLLRRSPGSYLVVSHGALLNMVLYAILGLNPHRSPASPRFYFSNTGYTTFTYDPIDFLWRMHNFNDNSHLLI